MSEYPLFDSIQEAGLIASLSGSNLSVRPASRVTAELKTMISENKTKLVKMLERSVGLPPCETCQGPQIAVRTFDGFENFECQQCNVCSGCRLGVSKPQELTLGGRGAA